MQPGGVQACRQCGGQSRGGIVRACRRALVRSQGRQLNDPVMFIYPKGVHARVIDIVKA